MKSQSLIVLVSMLMTQVASAASLQKTLESLGASYEQLAQELSDVDGNIFINLTYKKNDIVGLLKQSPTCQTEKNYKKVAVKRLTKKIETQFQQALDELDDGSDGYYGKLENLGYDLKDLEKALSGEQIEVCTDKSTPAYSDGHEANFVKVDGRVMFVFELGFPD